MATPRDHRPFTKNSVRLAQAIKARHAPTLRRLPNVCGLGVGFKMKNGKRLDTLAIRAYVTRKLPLSRLAPSARLPRTIEGVPVDVIVRAPRTRLFDPFHPDPAHAARHAVMTGGISIGIPGTPGHSTGTLGGSMFDNSTLLDVMLTCWHVACAEVNCSTGHVLQPSEFDGGGVQREVGNVVRSVLDPLVDCAILSLNGQAFLDRTVLDAGPLRSVVRAELGMAVRKSGRTSGLTTATVTDIDADVDVRNFSGDDGDVFHHENQIEFEGDDGMVQPGDSGSLLLDFDGNVVGLVFAGNDDGNAGDANHIANVLNALNINGSAGLTQQDFIAAFAFF